MLYRFGTFELEADSGELRKGGIRLPVQPQPVKVLLILVERAGALVTREEIRRQIWEEGTFVDFEQGLNVCIRQIRAALNDDAEKPRYIETLPRRGYRFVAPVERVRPAETSVAVAGLAAPPPLPTPAGRRRYWPLLAGMAFAAALLLATLIWQRHQPRLKVPEVRLMLAVLPFENLDTDKGDEYLSDGLTEEMITQLGALEPSRLGVIARTTSMQYRNTAKRADQIGHELGVNYLLEGSVRRSARRVRITAQLIQVSDQTHLWASTYDRDLGDILALESEVCQNVAEAIRLRLAPETSARLARRRRVEPEAFEAYLRGRYLWERRTVPGLLKSVEYFQQAIAQDPAYALAYAGLADSYNILGNFGILRPSEAYPKAKAAAAKALEIDDSLVEAQIALAFARFLYDWDWSAEQGFRKAIEARPDYGPAHQWYGVVLLALGRYDEAITQEKLAQQADPLSLIIRAVKGWVAYLAHRPDEAIAACRETLELDPNFSTAHAYLGLAYETKGRYSDAVRELEFASRSDRPDANYLDSLGHAYAVAGRFDAARALLRNFQQRAQAGYFPSYSFAIVYAGLGDKEKTFEWLEKAYRERFPWLIHLKSDPRLDGFHADPRFQDLARRVGLP